MNMQTRSLISVISLIMAIVFSISLLAMPALAATDSQQGSSSSGGAQDGGTTDEPSRIQAGYSFSDEDSLADEVGETYPLKTEAFGASLLSAAVGHREGGMFGYVGMDPVLFRNLSEISFGFWLKFSLDDAKSSPTVLDCDAPGSAALSVKLFASGVNAGVSVSANDGSASQTATLTFPGGEEDTWHHVAVTYKSAGSQSLLTLYVDGETSKTSAVTGKVNLSSFAATLVSLQIRDGMVLDEFYLTNHLLTGDEVYLMMNQPVAAFYALQQKEITGDGGIPEIPVTAHEYPWAAYLFERSFTLGVDFRDQGMDAFVDSDCARINTADVSQKFGYGLVRRSGTYPDEYAKLDSRLFQGQSAFTFAAWVYRSGKQTSNEEILLSLNGYGTLSFYPYAVQPDGDLAAGIRYTDSSGKVQQKTIGSETLALPNGAWVHYALCVSSSGRITVYVNGSVVAAFDSGVNPGTLNFSDCRLLTGCSASGSTRTIVDEVYIAPKVLSDSDIRKLHYSGVDKFVSGTAVDPGIGGSGEGEGSGEENPFAPDSTDVIEDQYSQTATIPQNGFIGTTFNSKNGYDVNGIATATITGGKYDAGKSSFGLTLDGTSFIRYPKGILDGATALTVGISYKWNGPSADAMTTQRLFDFSYKPSSVSQPTTYMYLDLGTGTGGLRFCISDGVQTTQLSYDCNDVDVWHRITVTIADGTVTLYLDDRQVAVSSTSVDLASLRPNFCYVGKSGVKGDPLFRGTVDEIYISRQALTSEQVAEYVDGIPVASSDKDAPAAESPTYLWLILVILIAVLLVGIGVTVLVLFLVRKHRRPKAERPADPQPSSFTDHAEPSLGPRSARRARSEAGLPEQDATVRFRKVTETQDPLPDSEATAVFRFSDSADATDAESTTKFTKVETDPEN